MLAIGRALMSRPRLLMMDEPSLGLAPIVIDHLADNITEINRRGVSVLLVEQNAGLVQQGGAAAATSSRSARSCWKATSSEMMSNDSVRRAFLG